jgi:hypothetical protein
MMFQSPAVTDNELDNIEPLFQQIARNIRDDFDKMFLEQIDAEIALELWRSNPDIYDKDYRP